MNCIPRRFSDIRLGSLGIFFYRHLHGGAPPVLLDCTWWCLLRVPPAPDAFLSFMLPRASHAHFCTDDELHVGTFIAIAVGFVPFWFLFRMSLKWVSVFYRNTLTIAVFYLECVEGDWHSLAFFILRRVFSSFPLLSSFCISCECHCTNQDHSPLSSFVSWG
jgi:hypothetical protein